MSFGLMMIYLIVISETLAQDVGAFAGKRFGEVWYSSKPSYVLLIGLMLASVVIKKEIAAFSWLANLLFASIWLFIVFSLILLQFDPRYDPKFDISDDLVHPKYQGTLLASICTVMVAYGYQ
jgi:amino acid permease